MWYSRKSNKYGNKTKVYSGEVYHSQKEANYAQEPDLLKKGKAIKDFKRQVRIPLDVNGYHICNYIVDFMVTNRDGSIELHI